MFNTTLNAQLGFPAAVAPLKFDTPRTRYYAITALITGAVWRDWHGPLCHQSSALYFIVKEKAFSETKKGGMNERTVTR